MNSSLIGKLEKAHRYPSEPARIRSQARARLLFALEEAPWNEERALERYELLYEAGLAPEASRDRGEAPDPAG